MSLQYNDNSVQYGSITAAIKSGTGGGASVGTYVLENVTINRPSKEIDRANEIGSPNGWVAVDGQVDGSCVVQMGDNTTKWPKNGNWFANIFDADIGSERFVLLNCGTPFEQNGYYKVNAKLKKANNPT